MFAFLKRNPKTTGTVGLAAAIALSTSVLIKPWEGLELTSYPDIVGVWTVCYGETQGVKPGQKFTKQQCEEKLSKRVMEDYAKPLWACAGPEFRVAPVKVQAALISWTYNVGVGAACKSTLVAKLKAGDLKGACNELLKWNKAGGRVVKGLNNRRQAELKVCLEGVAGK
jgi:lysozyme